MTNSEEETRVLLNNKLKFCPTSHNFLKINLKIGERCFYDFYSWWHSKKKYILLLEAPHNGKILRCYGEFQCIINRGLH